MLLLLRRLQINTRRPISTRISRRKKTATKVLIKLQLLRFRRYDVDNPDKVIRACAKPEIQSQRAIRQAGISLHALFHGDVIRNVIRADKIRLAKNVNDSFLWWLVLHEKGLGDVGTDILGNAIR